uniref:hypothetical protein n=1 Tax=Vibrio sp. 41 TaxID=65384 RepID=UPI000166004D|nr:hypothetical protein [Vibrio sp. 41]
MIVKFFKGDHSSVTNGLEYLEGGTKRRKVAPELLSGNPTVTRELLKEASAALLGRLLLMAASRSKSKTSQPDKSNR